MFADQVLCTYDDRGEVLDMGAHIPFGMYLELGTDIDTLNNNRENFRYWTANRIIHMDRKFAKEIMNFYGFSQRMDDRTRSQIALFTRCLSLTDCYWIKEADEDVAWQDANLFDNSLHDVVLEVALLGKNLTITNHELITGDVATDGTAPKAWLRKEDGFYLLKGDVNDSVRREVEASQILNAIGISTVQYREEIFREEYVSVCRCFTSKERNYVRASDFSLWCLNHEISFGGFLEKYREKFDLMNIGDYLVGNNDRHQDNWGFVFDSNFEIIDFAPVIDFDHAFLANGNTLCLPYRLLDGASHKTMKEAVHEVFQKYLGRLSVGADVSGYKYGEVFEQNLEGLKQSIEIYK